MHAARRRYWFEVGLAIIATALFVPTLVTREWIEILFGVDPDNGSGALEWALVVATGAVAVASIIAARAERNRPLAVPG